MDPSYVTRLQALLARHTEAHARGHRTQLLVGEAKALQRLLEVFDQMAQVQAQAGAPDGKPAFVVKVEAGGKGDESSLLRWAVAPNHAGRKLLRGQRFACYPVHDRGPLVLEEPAPRPPWPFPVSAHQEPA